MNKVEVYVSQGEKGIIKPLETLASCTWLGELSEEHRQELSKEFKEITQPNSIEETWQKITQKYTDSSSARRTYDLVEPFYGKDPNITKPKGKVSL